MYYDYFGLKQPPFKITPDTNLFFPGGERGAILDALIFAVTNGEGIVKVVGEVGSGKTMLCRMLQKELPPTVDIVYLANPSLSPENILHAIAFELKLPVDANTSKLLVMQLIQEYLLKKHSQNQQVVVFVEEAQGMPLATMEEIRLLSNLETNQNKLMQIVMFGQPELDQKIGRKEIRQLKERITYSFQLNPFKIDDIREYINSRLRICGYRSGELFSDSAFRSMARYSTGLVRRINILADKAMLAAYAANTNRITARHVKQAARDSEFLTGSWRYWLPSSVLGVMLIAAMAYWNLHENSIAGEQAAMLNLHPEKPTAPVSERTSPEEGRAAVTVISTPASPEPAAPEPAEASTETPGAVPDKNMILQLSDTLAGTAGDQDQQAGAGSDQPVDSNKESMAHPESPEAPQLSSADEDELEEQIIGLNGVFQLQDGGDSRLTDQEWTLLQQQLKALPPEEAVSRESEDFSGECKLCWTIIYRPLIESGNL